MCLTLKLKIMQTLSLYLIPNVISLSLTDRLNEGGPLFMYTILLVLLAIVILFVAELIRRKNLQKTMSLISSLSLFALVWGFLGQLIGLISAFDSIEAIGESLSPALIAGGLKVASLAPVFGMITFLIGRIAIIIFTVLKKE
tara:strand:+ start:197 stop:622 length:426 start_codon:yes stop_codon:yes gene_type:complete